VAFYITSVLGAGVLVVPGLAAQVAGPGSILAWLLVSAASYPFAYTFASLSSRNPESGGIYSFAKEAFGDREATVIAWLFLAWVIMGAPAISLAAGSYIAASVPLTRTETFIAAAVLLLIAYAVNYRGIRFSSRVQLVTVAVIIAVVSFAVITSASRVSPSNFTPFLPNGPASIGVAAALVVWSYLGYENASNVAEEFKDPKRDFNRSVAISFIIVSVLYLAVATVTVGTASYRAGGGVVPFSSLMTSTLGTAGGVVVSALAVVIIFGTVNAYTGGMARIVYAAARDGGFPRALAKVDQRTGVPKRSLVALLAVIMASLVFFYLLNFSIESAFIATSGAALLTYVIGSAAGIKLLREKGARRLLPIASLVVALAILPFIGALLGLSLAVALGGVTYHWWRSRRKA